MIPLTGRGEREEKCEGVVGGAEGKCAVDFSLPGLDGKKIKLSDYRGKVVFLNFWATWCPPCLEEMASMEQANKKLASNRFAMLAISIDSEGETAIRKFFKGPLPSFQILIDRDQKVSQRYGSFKVPETYIIDSTGRIRDKIEGVRQWNDSLIIHYLELLSQS